MLAKISATITIQANAPANPVITINGDTLLASNANQYQWFYSADSISYTAVSGATGQQLIVPATGYYYVQIADANGCTSNSATQYINVTSVLKIGAEDEITVHPNPSRDGKFFVLYNKSTSAISYKVYDAKAGLKLAGKFSNNLSGERGMIDLSNYPAGIYYLELNESKQTYKLVKQ